MCNLFLLLLFLIGLSLGSFLNVVIYRVHQSQSLLGRSFCPFCYQKIHWYDNLPLVSFVLLKGRCRACQHPISWQYPLVEFSMGVLTVLVFLFLQQKADFTFSNTWVYYLQVLVLCGVFLILAVYDAKYLLIPDIVLLPGIIFFWWVYLFLNPTLSDFFTTLAGVIFYVVVLGLLALITRGNGMGWGDVKLGILLGLFLKFPLSVYGLIVAFWLGAFVSVALLLQKKKKLRDLVPFAPFLIGGALLVWFFQDSILQFFSSYFFYT